MPALPISTPSVSPAPISKPRSQTLTVALAQTRSASGTVAVVVAALNLITTTSAAGEQAAAILVIADTLAAGGEVETGALVASPA